MRQSRSSPDVVASVLSMLASSDSSVQSPSLKSSSSSSSSSLLMSATAVDRRPVFQSHQLGRPDGVRKGGTVAGPHQKLLLRSSV